MNIKTKEQAEQFLDEYIKLAETMNAFNDTYNKNVTLCSASNDKEVFIYNGIEVLSTLLQLELENQKNQFLFYYKDYTVFQLISCITESEVLKNENKLLKAQLKQLKKEKTIE